VDNTVNAVERAPNRDMISHVPLLKFRIRMKGLGRAAPTVHLADERVEDTQAVTVFEELVN
jgi:hypothetical protein